MNTIPFPGPNKKRSSSRLMIYQEPEADEPTPPDPKRGWIKRAFAFIGNVLWLAWRMSR